MGWVFVEARIVADGWGWWPRVGQVSVEAMMVALGGASFGGGDDVGQWGLVEARMLAIGRGEASVEMWR